MVNKKIIPLIQVEEPSDAILQLATTYEADGADELYICNYRTEELEQETFLSFMRQLIKQIDVPVMIGIVARRFEDVKKALYTGANAVVIRNTQTLSQEVLKESIQRFGAEHIIVELGCLIKEDEVEALKICGIKRLLLDDQSLQESSLPYYVEEENEYPWNILVKRRLQHIRDYQTQQDVNGLFKEEDSTKRKFYQYLSKKNVEGIVSEDFDSIRIMQSKLYLKRHGVPVNTFESTLPFSEFKKNEQGLVPVIAQDYKTLEVLMMAYMNEEAYQATIKTGRMTYYSRSRNKLWVKGETSGNIQQLKHLKVDCDRDTLLAKVKQTGVACHTGNRSCFYTDLVKKEYNETNAFGIFEEIYRVILDRKEHPKEGSYTNYLFDKGIDKILKKCGEEATEIVIAAKNPEEEELKYEISDFLYHMMVLMVERGLEWEDVVKELSHRR